MMQMLSVIKIAPIENPEKLALQKARTIGDNTLSRKGTDASIIPLNYLQVQDHDNSGVDFMGGSQVDLNNSKLVSSIMVNPQQGELESVLGGQNFNQRYFKGAEGNDFDLSNEF